MEKEMKYLGDQTIFNSYLKEIYKITDEEYNKTQLHNGSVLPIAIDCFSLGVIVGKKAERAKLKINNAEILNRQRGLLLEIEFLKLRNQKLEELVENIKGKCSPVLKLIK